MDIAVGVLAVPERDEQARALAERVDADVLVVDMKHRGERWGHRETLTRLMNLGADWLVMLEDDALVVDDFVAKALGRLGSATTLSRLADEPPPLVSFYFGTGTWAGVHIEVQEARLQALVAEGEATGWVRGKELWHAVGFAVPMVHAPMLLWSMTTDQAHTDNAICAWCRQNKVPVWYTFPSLVDHRDDESTVWENEGRVQRKAVRFG